jgi:uncharacterized SAM-binding protein YcdF (DUF218 family)
MEGSAIRRIGTWLVIGAVVAWAVSVSAVIGWGARDGARPADAIVVLGAAQYAGRPSPVLKARLDHAVDLWKEGKAPWLVLTGGRGAGDTTSEAAVGRRYASLEAAAEILREHGLRRAILVSDPFHMLRLQILARRFGMEVYTSPTRTSPISANRTESVTYIVGESVKVPATILLGFFER